MTTDHGLTPEQGTIVVFSDIWCSFAHVTIFRLHEARKRLGLEGRVRFDHRAFPLELLNKAPSPRTGTDSEVGRTASLEPAAGWQLWQDKDWLYPSSTLLALEAIQAAKEQSLDAADQLDLGLRKAFWAESRSVANYHVILDVAEKTGVVDVPALVEALRDGRARKTLFEQADIAASDTVNCSPHLFLPDGTDHANPGIAVGWQGDYGVGWPVITGDEPTAVDALLKVSAL
ncbi:DsbA family protein [Actinosynnema sp. NPDC020468]|uniref:DsbA family oxidoreductase n=1 Tax=Actinosynnema sp. NPDC020468 TaxID=3154488 RepID=UPI00340EB70A